MDESFVTHRQGVAFTVFSDFDRKFNRFFVCLRLFFLLSLCVFRGLWLIGWLDLNDLDAELERTVCRDWTHRSLSIGIIRRAKQICLRSFCESYKSFVPTFDHLACAHCEWQRLVAVITCVEFGAIHQSAPIMSFDFVSLLNGIAFARIRDTHFELNWLLLLFWRLASLRLLGCHNIHNFDTKEERGVGLDELSSGLFSVRVVSRADKVCFCALFETHESLVPALDDHAAANCEFERGPSVVAGVELCSIEEGASVMGLDLVSFLD